MTYMQHPTNDLPLLESVPGLFLILGLGILLAVAFNVWLDHGCPTNGVITWDARVCIEYLATSSPVTN